MGAFLVGTTHTPVMAILMIFEMTLDSNLLLPLIIVTIVSRYLSVMIRPLSVYSQALGDSQTRLPYLMHVADLQLDPRSVITTNISANKGSELFCFSSIQHVWVVDQQGFYQGQISLQAMKHFLGEEMLKQLSAASVFMENDLPHLYADMALTDAFAVFAGVDADKLPVLAADGKLIGEISKTDLLLTLA